MQRSWYTDYDSVMKHYYTVLLFNVCFHHDCTARPRHMARPGKGLLIKCDCWINHNVKRIHVRMILKWAGQFSHHVGIGKGGKEGEAKWEGCISVSVHLYV